MVNLFHFAVAAVAAAVWACACAELLMANPIVSNETTTYQSTFVLRKFLILEFVGDGNRLIAFNIGIPSAGKQSERMMCQLITIFRVTFHF